MVLIDQRIPVYGEEYLAFGVISGDAHKAVPVSAFGVLLHNPSSPILKAMTLAEELSQALTVAEKYVNDFATPVAAYIMHLRRVPTQEVQIMEALTTLKVPEEWLKDRTIFTDNIVGATRFTELKQVVMILRAMANKSYGRGVIRQVRTIDSSTQSTRVDRLGIEQANVQPAMFQQAMIHPDIV